MNETILEALMQLFAIIARVDKDGLSPKARSIVVSYLMLHLNSALVDKYLQKFDDFLIKHHKKPKSTRKKKTGLAVSSVRVLRICSEINEVLRQKEKIIVILRLLEFVAEDEEISQQEMDFINTVAEVFNIEKHEYEDLKIFVTDSYKNIIHQNNLLIIDNKNEISEQKSTDKFLLTYKHIYRKNLQGYFQILHVESTNDLVFMYKGSESIYLNSLNIKPNHTYILDNGSILKNPKINPIYYSDAINEFIHSESSEKLIYNAEEIEFRFPNSTNGIQKFTFSEESGNLIGIMGGSGVGKSTLLNIFIGNYKLKSGKISINGYDLQDNKDDLEGVIGYIPQDDLMLEELTVFQNLYYNALLCFKRLSKPEIIERVNKVLDDLDLLEIKDLKVGTPLNKFISGGQRKRLNIALELIREPSVMFIDEPTSGLSSADSEMVMSLLKEQTLKGKLLIINIHQPSSDIYKLFDKIIVMDKGGYPVYYGNPIEAIVYFKTLNHHVNADESDCPICGNVNPEIVLEMIEAKVVNEYGKLTKSRKMPPEHLYKNYQEKINPKIKIHKVEEKLPIPENSFKIPNAFKQFKVFSIRNLLTKLTNKQYLLINLLEAPALALILGYFTKYIFGSEGNPNEYIFSENVNISAYLFMAVIVSLFMGLTVSAEEIIKDRKILKREAFLNLSKISYLNSKIIILFILSSIQTLSFVIIGNLILGIKGLTFEYWLILFSTSALANMIGLNISSALNSVVTIYITIPLILVPQILFSGTVVNFDKIHKDFTSDKFVPIIGDIMTSRWAYEALVVTQFKQNKYEKHFFEIDQKIKEADFISTILYDELETKITFCKDSISNKNCKNDVEKNLKIINNEIRKLSKKTGKNFKLYDKISYENFNNEIATKSIEYLWDIKKQYNKISRTAIAEKNDINDKLLEKYGSNEAITNLKNNYYNKRLADIVTNIADLNMFVESNNELIRKTNPIYKKAESNYGRAHFYAASKNLFGKEISTFWFNVSFIWFTSLLLYIALISDLLKKTLNFFNKINLLKKLRSKK